MIDEPKLMTTRDKALRVNLDSSHYGSFAEIGAGQEVVRWFFKVGGAAGTIAKSISAYDMKVSDAIYGTCERYVHRQRLQSMLDYEYNLNIERLNKTRSAPTCFFSFADTVTAMNYKGTNKCHGWMGIKFQTEPSSEPSQIILHVRMLDKNNLSQQDALGVVGVNLIHGACFLSGEPDSLLKSLLDSLSTKRIEIDMAEFSGPAFADLDNRVVSLRLVQLGLSNAALFAPDGTVLQPSEYLYKKPVLVERGSFRPVTKVNIDMLRCTQRQFAKEIHVDEEEVVTLMEITMANLMSSGELDLDDFLARADILAAVGETVLISNYSEYHRLAAYLRWNTNEPIAICMGLALLKELFDPKYYEELEGGVLEAFGRLFRRNVTVYVYPQINRGGDPFELNDLQLDSCSRNLFEYLLTCEELKPVAGYNPELLDIFSRDLLAKILQGDTSWEEGVPEAVAQVIKNRKLFGFPKQ